MTAFPGVCKSAETGFCGVSDTAQFLEKVITVSETAFSVVLNTPKHHSAVSQTPQVAGSSDVSSRFFRHQTTLEVLLNDFDFILIFVKIIEF